MVSRPSIVRKRFTRHEAEPSVKRNRAGVGGRGDAADFTRAASAGQFEETLVQRAAQPGAAVLGMHAGEVNVAHPKGRSGARLGLRDDADEEGDQRTTFLDDEAGVV